MEMQENNWGRYASRGTGDAALATGIIGTALGVLNGGAGILNLGGMGIGSGANYVNKETYETQLKLIDAERSNAILAADLSSEKKMVDVFERAVAHSNGIRDELQAQIRELDKRVDSNAAAQAVINCGFNSNIGILQTQVGQLMDMTKLMIPNTNVYTPPTGSGG